MKQKIGKVPLKGFLERRNNSAYRLLRIYHQIKRDFLLKRSHLPFNDRAIITFKGKENGKRCFVIGNGPSLRMKDLQALHDLNEVSFAFNKIYLAFNETAFRPSYYMIADRLVAENIKEDVKLLGPFVKLFPYDYKRLFSGIQNAYFFYVENRFRGSQRPICFCPDPLNICAGETVTYMALQMAVFLGCNPIYLIGVDFSFSLPNNKENGKTVVHGQGEKNHFHPDYRPNGEKWYAPDLNFQVRAYMAARAYAEENGIQIFNATRGGKLEVFERRNLDEVLADR